MTCLCTSCTKILVKNTAQCVFNNENVPSCSLPSELPRKPTSLLKPWRKIPVMFDVCMFFVSTKYKSVLKTMFLQNAFFLGGACTPGLVLSLARIKLPSISYYVLFIGYFCQIPLWFLYLLLHLKLPFSNWKEIKYLLIHSSSYFRVF